MDESLSSCTVFSLTDNEDLISFWLKIDYFYFSHIHQNNYLEESFIFVWV
jgi:hypothetical protein